MIGLSNPCSSHAAANSRSARSGRISSTRVVQKTLVVIGGGGEAITLTWRWRTARSCTLVKVIATGGRATIMLMKDCGDDLDSDQARARFLERFQASQRRRAKRARQPRNTNANVAPRHHDTRVRERTSDAEEAYQISIKMRGLEDSVMTSSGTSPAHGETIIDIPTAETMGIEVIDTGPLKIVEGTTVMAGWETTVD